MFCGLFTREPSSIACDDEQGDLFNSVGPYWKLRQPQPTQEKLKRGFGENEGELTAKVEIRKGKRSGQGQVELLASKEVADVGRTVWCQKEEMA